MTDLVEMTFVNSDAKPKRTTIRCDAAGAVLVAAWYGAYYAGDRYHVLVNGQRVAKDPNGVIDTVAK